MGLNIFYSLLFYKEVYETLFRNKTLFNKSRIENFNIKIKVAKQTPHQKKKNKKTPNKLKTLHEFQNRCTVRQRCVEEELRDEKFNEMDCDI